MFNGFLRQLTVEKSIMDENNGDKQYAQLTKSHSEARGGSEPQQLRKSFFECSSFRNNPVQFHKSDQNEEEEKLK